jgi:hypothetical protein
MTIQLSAETVQDVLTKVIIIERNIHIRRHENIRVEEHELAEKYFPVKHIVLYFQ